MTSIFFPNSNLRTTGCNKLSYNHYKVKDINKFTPANNDKNLPKKKRNFVKENYIFGVNILTLQTIQSMGHFHESKT